MHDVSYAAVLRAARVICATTTGAAMYKELLRSPGVTPGVVLVEEAGELLEAHVLTSLSDHTKHLIMVRGVGGGRGGGNGEYASAEAFS